MTGDETVEDTHTSEQVEEAATGRRWRFSLVMLAIAFGVGTLGVVYGPELLIYCALIIFLIFACIAAGSTGVDLTVGSFRAKAPFPRNVKRRKVVRRSGFPKKGRSPAEPKDPDEQLY